MTTKIRFTISQTKREDLFIETGKPQPATFDVDLELTKDVRNFLINACNLGLFYSDSSMRSALVDGRLVDFSSHSKHTVNSIDGQVALDEIIDKYKKELAEKASEIQKAKEAKEAKERELQQTKIANRKLIGNAALSIAFYDKVYYKAELENQTDAETLTFIRKSVDERNTEKAKKELQAKEKEEFAQEQNIEAARRFIEEKGSQLAQLRVKYSFAFISLVASEAVQDILKSTGKEFKTLSNSFYKTLSVAGSDDEPSLKHLIALDEVKKDFPDNQVQLEYIDEEDQYDDEEVNRVWYLTIEFEIFGKIKVVYLKNLK